MILVPLGPAKRDIHQRRPAAFRYGHRLETGDCGPRRRPAMRPSKSVRSKRRAAAWHERLPDERTPARAAPSDEARQAMPRRWRSGLAGVTSFRHAAGSRDRRQRRLVRTQRVHHRRQFRQRHHRHRRRAARRASACFPCWCWRARWADSGTAATLEVPGPGSGIGSISGFSLFGVASPARATGLPAS